MLTAIFGLIALWLCWYLLKLLAKSTMNSLKSIFKITGQVFNSRKVIRKKFKA